MFDEIKGLSAATIDVFNSITLDNYLDFRRKYMVQTDEEYVKYNQLQSLRSIESCQSELAALQKMYAEHKAEIKEDFFDAALAAENDILFNIEQQKSFYKDKLAIIPNAKHHVFFRYNSFTDILPPHK